MPSFAVLQLVIGRLLELQPLPELVLMLEPLLMHLLMLMLQLVLRPMLRLQHQLELQPV